MTTANTRDQGNGSSAVPGCLPGRPPAKLSRAWEAMPIEHRTAFLPHLLGGTSADWLAEWLHKAGTPVSATTIRTYRRALVNATNATNPAQAVGRPASNRSQG